MNTRFLTGVKDTDRSILMNLDDDRALITICLTAYGKELCDENFFRNYILRYFPKVYEIKNKENVKWKKVYYENAMIIGKLEELFGLTFDKSLNEYPAKVFNHLFSQLQRERGSKIRITSIRGNTEIENEIKNLKETKGPKAIWNDINHYMFNAAYGKNKNAFAYFVSLGGNEWRRSIQFLIEYDSKAESFDMLKFVLTLSEGKYIIEWDYLIALAQSKGRKDVVDYLISHKK
jgi:hypothetical protein